MSPTAGCSRLAPGSEPSPRDRTACADARLHGWPVRCRRPCGLGTRRCLSANPQAAAASMAQRRESIVDARALLTRLRPCRQCGDEQTYQPCQCDRERDDDRQQLKVMLTESRKRPSRRGRRDMARKRFRWESDLQGEQSDGQHGRQHERPSEESLVRLPPLCWRVHMSYRQSRREAR